MSSLTDKNLMNKSIQQVNYGKSFIKEACDMNSIEAFSKSQGLNTIKKMKIEKDNQDQLAISTLYDKSSIENEIIKNLRNALQESMEENTILRDRIIELEALLAAATDEIEKKDNTILELAEYIETMKSITFEDCKQIQDEYDNMGNGRVGKYENHDSDNDNDNKEEQFRR